jgi:hypothetical protein
LRLAHHPVAQPHLGEGVADRFWRGRCSAWCPAFR